MLLSQAKPGDRDMHTFKHRAVLFIPPFKELFDFSINHLCQTGQIESPKSIDCFTSEKIHSWRQTRDAALFQAGSRLTLCLCLREGFGSVFAEVNKVIQEGRGNEKKHTHTHNGM